MPVPGNALVSHAELLRYRLAVLDGPRGQGVGTLPHHRPRIDASRVGLHHPLATPGHAAPVGGTPAAGTEPAWKYVNLTRYLVYLQHSIASGTQWAVFENNGPTLWGKVSSTVEDFLLEEWQSGYLAGTRPAEAFFVRCDRTTMTPTDLDHGRLVCLVGVAPVVPLRFVIFMVGQRTSKPRP